jgi:hypothetical protein
MQKKTLALGALLASLGASAQEVPQGQLSMYQGYLTDAGQPLDGSYDFRYELYDVPSGGDPLFAGTNSAVAVNKGGFVMEVYSSPAVEIVPPGCWLDIGVRPTGSPAEFIPLAPRQRIMPAPYAYRAQVAEVYSGPIGTNQLAGTYANALALVNPTNQFVGNGSGLTALNASSLNSGTVAEALIPNLYWKFGGNSGTTPGMYFLGTTDNQPLELKVNSGRALRLEPNVSEAPNLIGGARYNLVRSGVVGATIAGGGAADYSTLGALTNQVLSDFGTIGGGSRQLIESGANSSTIAGGYFNEVGTNANAGAIGGGRYNSIGTGARDAVVAGGYDNDIDADSDYAVVSGGTLNKVGAGAGYAVVGGGRNNSVATNADYATIPGGRDARATAYGEWAYASGSLANPGDAQTSLFVARNITSNAAPTSLFLDGSAAEIPVATKETMAFDILVTARSTTGNSAAYHIRGVIAGQPGGTVAFVGTPLKTVLGEAVPGWDVNVEASSMTLKIKATGSVSEAIAWSARIGATKMIWPIP